jgi:hypothetical protein
MAVRFSVLRKMPIKELIDNYDKRASYTQVGPSFFLEEIYRRDNEKTNKKMLRYTRWITFMTLVMMATTLVNVMLFFSK